MNALIEARRVVGEVANQVTSAERLRSDEVFLCCLAEEIELACSDPSIECPKAVFEICESGNVKYKQLADKETFGQNYLLVPLLRESSKPKSESSDLCGLLSLKAKEYLDLDIAEKKRQLLDHLLKESKK